MVEISEYGDTVPNAYLDEWGKRRINGLIEDGTKIIAAVGVAPIIKQWSATLKIFHVLRRPERKMFYTQTLKTAYVFTKPLRVIKISAFLNLIHVQRRPYRLIRLLQRSELIHEYYVSKPGIKKTRLFLVVGELALQLSGD
ncbi:MAG: hypothetical protein QXJ31_01965 [Candidatus Bathyarchaeia archaeon]